MLDDACSIGRGNRMPEDDLTRTQAAAITGALWRLRPVKRRSYATRQSLLGIGPQPASLRAVGALVSARRHRDPNYAQSNRPTGVGDYMN